MINVTYLSIGTCRRSRDLEAHRVNIVELEPHWNKDPLLYYIVQDEINYFRKLWSS